jgi:iron complex outermembrane recepter protein
LRKERATQADLGLTANYADVRSGVTAFYAEIDDFITYDAPHLLFGPHLQHAIGVNHDVRMAGGEFYSELDLTNMWTAFGTLSYVQATDRDLDEPLWGIAPLDTRMGLRVLDPVNQRWGSEYILRLVDSQNRVTDTGFQHAHDTRLLPLD